MPLPDNWNEIRWKIYDAAMYRCEHCGMEFVWGTTRAKHVRNAVGNPIILTVHHIDGNQANNDPNNLVALCQICHLHVQALWKPGWTLPLRWDGVPKWILNRKLPYKYLPRLPGF